MLHLTLQLRRFPHWYRQLVLHLPPSEPRLLAPSLRTHTHFHRPNGRCSDGRLILDFLGIPQIPPYPLAFSVNFWDNFFCFFVKLSLWGFCIWNRIWVSRTARWHGGILSRVWILRWPEPWRWTAVSLKKRGSLLMWPQTFLSEGSVRLFQGIAAFSLQFFFK